MGRTNTTYRDLLQAMESRWSKYRRALRHADEPVFDRLFEYARAHADASGVQNHQFVEIPALISMLIEQQKQIEDLEDRLDHVEDELNDRG
ncbi:hypothetical protein [Haladaptatus sp. DYF46]|uniref:hypothetical protein n=1 Tax=Haladaptatus sp. DYF46 TaxID=2886041 RepID=UPI001E51B757|nr:hypothetical protein [Haladaptatus sp. DYF46]